MSMASSTITAEPNTIVFTGFADEGDVATQVTVADDGIPSLLASPQLLTNLPIQMGKNDIRDKPTTFSLTFLKQVRQLNANVICYSIVAMHSAVMITTICHVITDFFILFIGNWHCKGVKRP